ncbi:MAG: carboxylating nicotinate-nucleotide diphosphorylase [Verrucomicrobiota bacterium]|jgi:nicotinate-nucleotide pyrophosphorylase (carboxylating)|nr:carboxylating nicotinate-nucleotide diphosphorylase [Verrucomicrobiota bacterium]
MNDVMADRRALAAVEAALAEDVGTGDATTLALVDPEVMATGEILAREACRVAGVTVGQSVLRCVDPALQVEVVVPDGRDVAPGGTILTMRGRAASILVAERTALNFMQRMCGIATLTGRFVEAVQAYGTMILDTRKTTPNLRLFEKYAVVCGGGVNHRFGLYDRVLLKDNHRRLWQGGDPDRLDLAVAAARRAYPQLAVEIEVESVAECVSALRGKPEWIMLDNMGCDMMRACVALCRGVSRTEASGGITLARAREVAATGVDAISLGCLTHSAPSVDLSLEWSVV